MFNYRMRNPLAFPIAVVCIVLQFGTTQIAQGQAAESADPRVDAVDHWLTRKWSVVINPAALGSLNADLVETGSLHEYGVAAAFGRRLTRSSMLDFGLHFGRVVSENGSTYIWAISLTPKLRIPADRRSYCFVGAGPTLVLLKEPFTVTRLSAGPQVAMGTIHRISGRYALNLAGEAGIAQTFYVSDITRRPGQPVDPNTTRQSLGWARVVLGVRIQL